MDDGPYFDTTRSASPISVEPDFFHRSTGSSTEQPVAAVQSTLTQVVRAHIVPSLLVRNHRDDAAELADSEGRALVAHFVDLLDRDNDGAYETFAFERLDTCEDPQLLARTLLEPAARLIGAGWCADTRDFARVTFAVSRLQRLFWSMIAQSPPKRRADPRKLALLAPAPGEQHTFGLSIVEDLLRRAGWEVDCCRMGEQAEMYRLVGVNRYAFVGLSISGNALLPACSSAIAKLRARSRNRSIAVLAGGSFASANPHLLLNAGADQVLETAAALVGVAERMLKTAPRSDSYLIAAE